MQTEMLPLIDNIEGLSCVYLFPYIFIDRPFRGMTAKAIKGYTADYAASPPYMSVLKLQERAPGNKFDKTTSEDVCTVKFRGSFA